MSLLKSIQKIAITPSVYIGGKISGLLGVEKRNQLTPAQAVETKFGKVLGTAITGTGVALAITTIPAGAVISAGKSLIPKTFLGKAVAVTVAPTVATYVLTNPETIVKSGISFIDLQKTGISVASGDTSLPAGALDYVKEHPIATAVAGVVGAFAVGKVVAPIVGGLISRSDSDVTVETLPAQPLPAQQITQAYPQDAINSASPTQPEIEAIPGNGVSRRKTRKKTRQEPLHQTISQRVNVEVQANRINKTYLNKIVVAQ